MKKSPNREKARELRAKGYNNTAIAKELGVSYQRVAQYFSGEEGCRHYHRAACIYPKIDEWLYTNRITIGRFVVLLGNDYNATSSNAMRYKLNGKVDFKKREIDKILKLTGMTYEECFANDVQV